MPVQVKKYPHSDLIDYIMDAMGERRLTDEEVGAVLNAKVFEAIVDGWLPDLREAVANLEEGSVEFENAQAFIAHSANKAHLVGIELATAKVNLQRVTPAVKKEIDRVLKAVK